MNELYYDLLDITNISNIKINNRQIMESTDIQMEFFKIINIIGWEKLLIRTGQKNIWNGALLKFIKARRNGESELVLETCATDYVSFLGSNYGLRKNPELLEEFSSAFERRKVANRLGILLKQKAMYLNQADIESVDMSIFSLINNNWFIDEEMDVFRKMLKKANSIVNIKDSVYSNPLSLNITLIANNKILFQKRGEKTAHGDYGFQTSIASFVTPDTFINGIFNVNHAVKVVMNEELGTIEDSFNNLTITGLVRDKINFEIGITAYSTTESDLFSDLDDDESKPFFIKNVHEIKKDETYTRFMPLGAASIIKYLDREVF